MARRGKGAGLAAALADVGVILPINGEAGRRGRTNLANADRTQKSEHVLTCGMRRAPIVSLTTMCQTQRRGREVFGQNPYHSNRVGPLVGLQGRENFQSAFRPL